MSIDFLSTSAALRKLSDGRATESYVALQFCSWIAFVVLLEAIDAAIVDSRSELSILHGVTSAFVSLVGIGYCYWRNGARDFVRRFTVLALPVSVQLAVVYEFFYWGCYFVYPVISRSLDDTLYEGIWLTYELVLSLALTLAWFLRLSNLMRRSAPNE